MHLPFLILSFNMLICQAKVKYRGFNDVAMMSLSRSDLTATLVDDGSKARVYINGGCTSPQVCPPQDFCYCTEITSACSIFYPDTLSWSTCQSAPRNRSRHVDVYFDNKVYLFGGRDISDSLVEEVDIYDISSDEWLPPLLWSSPSSDLGVFLEDDSIYLIGGYDSSYAPLSRLVKFTVSSGLWNYSLTAMPTARGDVGSVTIRTSTNNKQTASPLTHMVIGGFGTDICKPLSTVESYSVSDDVWTTLMPLQLPRADMAIGVIDNKIFVVAGETKNLSTCSNSPLNPGISLPVNDVERYVPDSGLGVWEYEEDIPADRFRFQSASYGKQIFLFGGQASRVIPSDPTDNSFYPVLNTTMLYVPHSIAEEEGLNDGEIALIVIGVLAALALLAAGVISFMVWYHYRGYSKTPDKERDEAEDVRPGGGGGGKAEMREISLRV
jgi:hypothetical protein